jgi:proteasome lid subunit RPN8/RPN11
MRISRADWEEIVAHAREEAPNECCGYARIDDGRIGEVVRAENIRHSQFGFEFGFEDLSAMNDLDEQGVPVAVYHSHPRVAPRPSQQDINVVQYPHWLYLIVSLQGDEPEIRAWRIVDRRVTEEDLVVE